MVAIAIMLGMLALPFVLWIAGVGKLIVISVGLFIALCAPSIVYILYRTVRSRTWPKIAGGPSITWAGKRIGF